jgi:hypothetical protein
MPGIIDSSPECVTNNEGAKPADDIADFIIGANYEDCAGFMTFGPGSTYGEDGSGAESIYMILTWLGIIVTLAALAAWVIYENRQLIRHVARFGGPKPAAGGIPPQPGGVGDEL